MASVPERPPDGRPPGVLTLLKISASQYSGSTLLAFLLNTHPEIFTVSEMDGHAYGDRSFRCSCGSGLSECPFFRHVRDAFVRDDLPFAFDAFGTGYHLVKPARLNRLLTRALPRLPYTPVETLRDRLVGHLPRVGALRARHDRANLAFVRAAIAYSRARVFVDACKSPFRLRHLRRIRELEIYPLYLVRDPRGLALSNKRKRGWDVAVGIRHWINEQRDILRISAEFPTLLTVYYEDLCDRPDEALAAIHRFVGLEPHPFSGDFRSVEHHVLGNRMRLGDLGKIEKDARWEHELSTREIAVISQSAFAFVRRYPDHPLSAIVTRYLGAP